MGRQRKFEHIVRGLVEVAAAYQASLFMGSLHLGMHLY